MTPLTQEILRGIAADEPEAFLAANETVRAFTFGMRPNVSILAPYAELLARDPPAETDIEAIKQILIDTLTANQSKNLASTVYILGMLEGDEIVPLLRQALATHARALLRQNQIFGNLLCALNNNGEEIISGSSYSIDEMDKNVADARKYLARLGEVVPW